MKIEMTENRTPKVKIKLENVDIKELKVEDDIAYFLCIYKADELASDDELTEGMNFALQLFQG